MSSWVNLFLFFFAFSCCTIFPSCSSSGEPYEKTDLKKEKTKNNYKINSNKIGSDTANTRNSYEKPTIPKKCVMEGHDREKPASFQIINRIDPDCASVATAIKKKEKAEFRAQLIAQRKEKANKTKRDLAKRDLEVIAKLDDTVMENPIKPPPDIRVSQIERERLPKFQGTLLEAFSGDDPNLFYFVTSEYIYILKTPYKVLRKIEKTGYDVRNVSPTGVSSSGDAKWIWRNYFLAENIPEGVKEPEYFSRTDIYNKNGDLWWSINGIVSAVSPDGKKAVLVYPEHSGIGYINKHENKMVDIAGVNGPADACVYNNGMTIVSILGESSIVTLGPNLDIVSSINVLGSCRINLCLASEGLAFVECCNYDDDISIMYTLDSRGKVIQKNPFFTWGNRIRSIDWQKRKLLLGVFTGESYIFDIDTGKAEVKIGRLEGLEKTVPFRQFRNKHRGNKREYFLYASSVQKRNKEKYLVYKALLFGNSILRLRSPQGKKIGKSNRHNPILEVVDFSGNRLYKRKLNINTINTGFNLKFPLTWAAGKYVRILLDDCILNVQAEKRSSR